MDETNEVVVWKTVSFQTSQEVSRFLTTEKVLDFKVVFDTVSVYKFVLFYRVNTTNG